MKAAGVCLALLLSGGCIFDTSGLAPSPSAMDGADAALWDVTTVQVDGAPADAGTDVRDGPRRDGAGDRPLMDQPVPDQPMPDQPVPDQPVPDQPSVKPPCATTYGSVSGFIKLCSETATECMFYFKSGSCDAKCGAGGGTCIKAAAEKNDTCILDYATSCGHVHSDGLCTCSR